MRTVKIIFFYNLKNDNHQYVDTVFINLYLIGNQTGKPSDRELKKIILSNKNNLVNAHHVSSFDAKSIRIANYRVCDLNSDQIRILSTRNDSNLIMHHLIA